MFIRKPGTQGTSWAALAGEWMGTWNPIQMEAVIAPPPKPNQIPGPFALASTPRAVACISRYLEPHHPPCNTAPKALTNVLYTHRSLPPSHVTWNILHHMGHTDRVISTIHKDRQRLLLGALKKPSKAQGPGAPPTANAPHGAAVPQTRCGGPLTTGTHTAPRPPPPPLHLVPHTPDEGCGNT